MTRSDKGTKKPERQARLRLVRSYIDPDPWVVVWWQGEDFIGEREANMKRGHVYGIFRSGVLCSEWRTLKEARGKL